MIVEVSLDGNDQPVMVKRATTAAEHTQLQEEASLLARVARAGVVALAGSQTPEGDELRLVWTGTHSLATCGRLEPVAIAATIAQLTETVAELHASGVAHNRISADHVLLDGSGAPVLCSFSGATPISPGAVASDVAALGALLSGLLSDHHYPDLEPIPQRHSPLRRHDATASQRKVLLALADHASADDPLSRPTAAALARSIRTAVPEAAMPPANHVVAPPVPVSGLTMAAPSLAEQLRRRASLLLVLTGVALVLFGVHQLTNTGAERPVLQAQRDPITTSVTATGRTAPQSTDNTAPVSGPTTSSTVTSPSSTVATSSSPGCAAVARPAADIDGDGCDDALAIGDGTVSVKGVTYQVGQAGDQVVVADWRCNHHATAALLRPTTGEVFVFADWATPTHDVTVGSSTVIERAVGLRVTDNNSDSCFELTVDRSDGGSTVVKMGGGR